MSLALPCLRPLCCLCFRCLAILFCVVRVIWTTVAILGVAVRMVAVDRTRRLFLACVDKFLTFFNKFHLWKSFLSPTVSSWVHHPSYHLYHSNNDDGYKSWEWVHIYMCVLLFLVVTLALTCSPTFYISIVESNGTPHRRLAFAHPQHRPILYFSYHDRALCYRTFQSYV